jgi:hypothetical protein
MLRISEKPFIVTEILNIEVSPVRFLLFPVNQNQPVAGYFPDSELNELPIKHCRPPVAVNSPQHNMRAAVICVVLCDGDPFR